MLLSGRLLFFGGKGGVGKTTMAAAAAFSSARAGASTLLVSTDPAHSTSDLLGVELSDEPTVLEANLWGIEADARAHVDAFLERVKDDARHAVSPEVLPTVRKHLELARSAPGIEESGLLERLMDLIERCPDPYQRIVFDTAPTGHTLRLLAAPQVMTAWVEGLVRQREKAAGAERMARNLVGRRADR